MKEPMKMHCMIWRRDYWLCQRLISYLCIHAPFYLQNISLQYTYIGLHIHITACNTHNTVPYDLGSANKSGCNILKTTSTYVIVIINSISPHMMFHLILHFGIPPFIRLIEKWWNDKNLNFSISFFFWSN